MTSLSRIRSRIESRRFVRETVLLAIRFQKFLMVGGVGFAVNMLVLFALTDGARLFYLASSLTALEVALFVTFALNERYTWGDRRFGSVRARLWRYQVIGSVAIGINAGLLFALTEFGGLYYLVANLWGAAAAAIWNFSANHLLTWTPRL